MPRPNPARESSDIADAMQWRSAQEAEWQRIMNRFADLKRKYADSPDAVYAIEDIRRESRGQVEGRAQRFGTRPGDDPGCARRACDANRPRAARDPQVDAIIGGGALLLFLLTRKPKEQS